jgi:hypothetical protein
VLARAQGRDRAAGGLAAMTRVVSGYRARHRQPARRPAPAVAGARNGVAVADGRDRVRIGVARGLPAPKQLSEDRT